MPDSIVVLTLMTGIVAIGAWANWRKPLMTDKELREVGMQMASELGTLTAERDALRAEKAEWVRVFDDMVLVQQRTEAERDALRAERDDAEARVEQWHAASMNQLSEIRALRAEVERLEQQRISLFDERDRRDDEVVRLDNAIAVLQTEIERLRAALRQILEDPDAKILDSHRDDGWEAVRHA